MINSKLFIFKGLLHAVPHYYVWSCPMWLSGDKLCVFFPSGFKRVPRTKLRSPGYTASTFTRYAILLVPCPWYILSFRPDLPRVCQVVLQQQLLTVPPMSRATRRLYLWWILFGFEMGFCSMNRWYHRKVTLD